MSDLDLRSKTNDQLFDRLAELEQTLTVEPVAGTAINTTLRDLVHAMQEVGLIHIELAKRTATGWRPL